jgi:phosphoserine aminotransferase
VAQRRPYNFAPGPAALPEAVLEKAAAEMLDWRGTGMSVMEMSHRGPHFLSIFEKTVADFHSLLGLGSDHRILFMQGGATAQNAIVPLNLLAGNPKCDYVHTGHWSAKSLKEAQRYGDMHLAASAEQAREMDGAMAPSFGYVPPVDEWQARPDAAYLHICGNETIGGVEYHQWPDMAALGAPHVPLVIDMSSHILSRPMDFSKVALAYGGAQKNIGPSGLTFVILREDLIRERAPRAMASCPSVFDYRGVLDNDSMLNTPSTYPIYIAGLVFEWLLEQGGVEAMGRLNAQKAALLYSAFDGSDFYQTKVARGSRSWMNVPFYLPDDRLYEPFLAQAKARGLLSLKGHKAVGGLRASIYNAMPLEGVQALVAFLADFEKEQA